MDCIDLEYIVMNLCIERSADYTLWLAIGSKHLPGGNMCDISCLSHMIDLTVDDMWVNISATTQFPELHSLEISESTIHSVDFLSNCKKLHTLNMRCLCVTGGSTFQSLTNIDLPCLIHLNLSYTNISDISFLRRSPLLEELDLSFTNINDASALKYCSNLKHLDLCETKITDINPLKKCTNLQKLVLSDKNIKHDELRVKIMFDYQ